MAAQALPAQRIEAAIDGKNYVLHPNKKEPRSPYQRLVDIEDSANGGPFRTGQIGERIFKLLNLIHPNEGFKNISTMFMRMWTVTIIPRLPGASKAAVDSVIEATKPGRDDAATKRKYLKAVAEVTDGISAWGYALSSILACIKKTGELSLSVLKAADTVTFVHDVAELKIHAEDFNKARVAAIKAQQMGGGRNVAEVEKNLVETQRWNLLKAAKAALSVAGFILGLALTASGAVIPGLAIVAASMSLGASLFAMGATVQEESMKYERVKFFDERHVQHIPAPAA